MFFRAWQQLATYKSSFSPCFLLSIKLPYFFRRADDIFRLWLLCISCRPVYKTTIISALQKEDIMLDISARYHSPSSLLSYPACSRIPWCQFQVPPLLSEWLLLFLKQTGLHTTFLEASPSIIIFLLILPSANTRAVIITFFAPFFPNFGGSARLRLLVRILKVDTISPVVLFSCAPIFILTVFQATKSLVRYCPYKSRNIFDPLWDF